MMAYATPDHGQYERYTIEFGHLSHILYKWNLLSYAHHVNKDTSISLIVTRLLEYKPLRGIGCTSSRGCCRSETGYKDFGVGLQELENFKTNDEPEVVSLLKKVELGNDS
jgi:hypothetical protein